MTLRCSSHTAALNTNAYGRYFNLKHSRRRRDVQASHRLVQVSISPRTWTDRSMPGSARRRHRGIDMIHGRKSSLSCRCSAVTMIGMYTS
eukprot:2548382-Rhodomonas_salina.1